MSTETVMRLECPHCLYNLFEPVRLDKPKAGATCPACGQHFALDPEIRAMGKLLAEQCAPTMKRLSLELGGNAPFIVFDDADIALAVLTRGAYNQASISNAAGQAFSQEFEAEADYVGLYLMAHTNYSIADAPKFWRRMAAANPGSIKGSMNASHPATPYRMVALERAVTEIEKKRREGLPLLPERKDGKPFVPGEGLIPGAPAKDDDKGCFLNTDGRCMPH